MLNYRKIIGIKKNQVLFLFAYFISPQLGGTGTSSLEEIPWTKFSKPVNQPTQAVLLRPFVIQIHVENPKKSVLLLEQRGSVIVPMDSHMILTVYVVTKMNVKPEFTHVTARVLSPLNALILLVRLLVPVQLVTS